LLVISGAAKAAGQWTLKELEPAKGFAGAIALQHSTSNTQHPTPNNQLGNRELVVKCWKWES